MRQQQQQLLLHSQFYHFNLTQPETFPEHAFVHKKPNVGICFSGGGTRSYEASLGYLKGLHDAGLLRDIRYISTVSGGSWANAVFSFHDKTIVSLEDLLGVYTAPEEMDIAQLSRMHPGKSARYYPVKKNLILELVRELTLRRTNLEDIWVKAIHETFLAPSGISLRALPAQNLEQVRRTLARNPGALNQLEFRALSTQPFPIINMAMLGPIEAAPFGVFTRRYTMMETTPLYVGFPHAQNISYPNADGSFSTLMLGGLVEPAGFGSVLEDTVCGLGRCPNATIQPVPLPRRPFSIANATAASSWAPGALIAEQGALSALENVLLTAPYYSPLHGGSRTNDVFLGDGENIENQGVLTLLRRGVGTICMFINSMVPLAPRRDYNPHWRIRPRASDVDASFMNLFGHRTLLPPLGEDYAHVQVFRKRDFARVITALQDSYVRGAGSVARVRLQVLENAWWGIPGGREVNMVFVYMSRCLKWEEALPAHVADLVAPQRANSTSPKALPKRGKFADFPHISTANLHITAPVANALADMSAWVIKENINLFMEAVRGEE